MWFLSKIINKDYDNFNAYPIYSQWMILKV